MSGSSSSQPSNVTSKVTTSPQIPSYVSDAQKSALHGAQSLVNSGEGFKPYPGQYYLSMPSQMEGVLQSINRMAETDSGLLSGLMTNQGLLAKIGSGENGITVPGVGRDNADFQGVVDRAVQDAVAANNANFSAGGRFGSTAHQGTTMDTAGDIAGSMYAGQYNQDVAARMQAEAANIANQTGAMGMMAQYAPMMESMRYDPLMRQLGVAETFHADRQGQMQAEMDRWNQEQMAKRLPYEWLNSQAAGVGPFGSIQTSTVPQGSRTSGLLGGALMGGVVGNQIMPGWGGAAGAAGGGLLGMFA